MLIVEQVSIPRKIQIFNASLTYLSMYQLEPSSKYLLLIFSINIDPSCVSVKPSFHSPIDETRKFDDSPNEKSCKCYTQSSQVKRLDTFGSDKN